MKKFYVECENYNVYIDAEVMDLHEGYLSFISEHNAVAIFAPGKWEYFKEVSIENV